MKIYCDENIESAIIDGLIRRGIEVISVRDTIAHQWQQGVKEHKGILYAHPLDLSPGECIRMVELVTQVLTEEEMKNHIAF